jgi:hypothetical protein
MADLANLQLDKQHDDLPVPPGGRRVWPVLLVIPLLGLVGYLLWSLTRREPSSPVSVATDRTVASSPAPTTPLAVEESDLPPLPETDAIVRRLLGALSSHPRAVAWLSSDQLLRNFAVVVQNIGSGTAPAQHLRMLRPTGDFIVDEGADETGDEARINPRSYRRYDDYADAIAALDAQAVARIYATLKPRIQDAYRELGYPDEDFDRALERAFGQLLRTPVVDGDVALVPHSVQWDYADPKLRSLTSAQRQFLRMGPRNVRMIQAKLREIAPHLGISPS